MFRKSKSKSNIAEKKVTILGIGGLGANTAMLLTQAGVKKIRLVDFDKVEACNLNRGQVFTYNDIGKYKVDVAAQNIGKVNNTVIIEPIIAEIRSREDIVRYIDDADFVVRAADKPINLFNQWFNQACIELDKPFIYGGMNEYLGVYGPLCIPGKTPCMDCTGAIQHGNSLEILNSEWVRSPSWGPLMGFIGDLMGNDIIAYLKGNISQITTTQFVIDAFTMVGTPRKILRNPECRSCGDKK